MSEVWGDAINLLDVESDTLIPVDYATPLWEATMEWVARHGVDAMRVPAGSVLERDAARYEIRYDLGRLDVDGGPLMGADNEWVSDRVTERGEGPPMPFPT